jgi:hypothetical protein
MRQFETPRRRWEDNIKTHVEEMGYDEVDETGSVSYTITGLDVSIVEPLVSAARMLVNYS